MYKLLSFRRTKTKKGRLHFMTSLRDLTSRPHDFTTSVLFIGNKPEGQGGGGHNVILLLLSLLLLFLYIVYCILYCIVIVFIYYFHL